MNDQNQDPEQPVDFEAEKLGEDGGEGRRTSSKRYTLLSDRNRCRFTRAGVDRIDYKDVVTLQKLMTSQGKIFSRKRSGNAARFQRMVKVAIKRARFMALLPYPG
jgi:small subunit ribosomal protein S18